jgi:hypothetical protein
MITKCCHEDRPEHHGRAHGTTWAPTSQPWLFTRQEGKADGEALLCLLTSGHSGQHRPTPASSVRTVAHVSCAVSGHTTSLSLDEHRAPTQG